MTNRVVHRASAIPGIVKVFRRRGGPSPGGVCCSGGTAVAAVSAWNPSVDRLARLQRLHVADQACEGILRRRGSAKDQGQYGARQTRPLGGAVRVGFASYLRMRESVQANGQDVGGEKFSIPSAIIRPYLTLHTPTLSPASGYGENHASSL